VVVLAGYKATPAEEIQDMADKSHQEQPEPPQENPVIVSGIDSVTVSEGVNKKTNKPYKKFTIHVGENKLSTFSESFAKEAKRAKETALDCRISYKQSTYGLDLVNLEVIEAPIQEEETH